MLTRTRTLIVLLPFLLAPFPAFSRQSFESRWVHFGSDGKLQFGTSERGDRIPDFSSVGDRGCGVACSTNGFTEWRPG
jgi:hypothetical protein